MRTPFHVLVPITGTHAQIYPQQSHHAVHAEMARKASSVTIVHPMLIGQPSSRFERHKISMAVAKKSQILDCRGLPQPWTFQNIGILDEARSKNRSSPRTRSGRLRNADADDHMIPLVKVWKTGAITLWLG